MFLIENGSTSDTLADLEFAKNKRNEYGHQSHDGYDKIERNQVEFLLFTAQWLSWNLHVNAHKASNNRVWHGEDRGDCQGQHDSIQALIVAREAYVNFLSKNLRRYVYVCTRSF